VIESGRLREPIAILGTALRLPGGVSSPERFWEALANGEELIGTVPPERWNAGSFKGADPDEVGTTYDVRGGFISGVDAFDADFFGMHSREASKADPQQRILLELTWEALERSSIDPQILARSQTGIWVGISNNDWTRMLLEDPRKIDGYTGVGGSNSVAAGRIAHFLGTYGPAEVIDTACSSSLVALHHAVQSLRRGETNLAIVGGANLILSPDLHVCFSRSGMLSRSGRCHTFADDADGYVRSEGCCIVVLKRLADAQREGDPILAVIHGTAVNQDGRSARLTAPNVRAQQKVMRSALADAEIEASAVNYVEAHGTGTPLGDPMEFLSIGSVYGAGRSASSPLYLGSVKTNLGHGEGVAGLTGLIKVVLMLQPGRTIAPHLHCSLPNSRINWRRWPIEIPHAMTSWPQECNVHFAGISSFGFSGTNAHVIVSSAGDVPKAVPAAAQPYSDEALLCISAVSQQALRAMATGYVDFLQKTDESFADICRSALCTRARLTYRLAVRATDSLDAANLLERWLAGDAGCGVITGSESEGARENLATGDALGQLAADFLAGERPRIESSSRRVGLPPYPFQRQRYWFGEAPEIQWRREREQVWNAVCSEAERQSLQGPLGWKPENYSERWATLERLTLAYARNVLIHAGAFAGADAATVSEVMANCGFLPIYRRLVGRWLRNLTTAGILEGSDGWYRPVGKMEPVALEGIWRDTEKALQADPGLLTYFRRCGALLEDVLTGKISSLETLFPEGSFDLTDALYQRSLEARYCNAIVANSIRTAVQAWGTKRNVRVLEIGAGTGGTTSAVVPLLPPDETEYWFTDVSELFLRRARKNFDQFPFVRYGHFNLDSEPEEQNVPIEYFDVVVASNAVHASRNLPVSLQRIQRMLAPGGILVLIETTFHQTCFDMSIGLIEGWQHFEDSERAEHPLLSASRWRDVLVENGFEQVSTLPMKDSPASLAGQHVVLAQRDFVDSDHLSRAAVGYSEKGKGFQEKLQTNESRVTTDFVACTEAERVKLVGGAVRRVICKVCQLTISPEELGDRDRLGDLGMDSLIALELRNELSKALGLEGKISATIGFDTGTVGELTNRLLELISSKTVSASSQELERVVTDSRMVTEEAIQGMTDAEVEELLRERLAEQ
jgi:3-oxoacyl-(acyl-carrier-protein) synthase/SAM-dependent methyltransferase/acyl carrier protein